MNKKKFIPIGMVAVLVMAAVIGGTSAYFRAKTTTKNKISAGNIGIALSKYDISDIKGMPGDEIKAEVKAKNTKNNSLYLRVTLQKNWENEKGEKIQKADASYIEVFTENDKEWIIQSSDKNKEEIYFYYKKALSPGTSTSNIIDKIKIGNIPSKEQEIYAGMSIRLSMEADAVQEVGAEKAILSTWGLEVKIDKNGTLQYVEE